MYSQLNTAQALEAMTDRGKFERLATSVLREHKKEYATIVNTGINAKGEPIKSPLDGFCQVPESEPPHFLLVEHTTTAPKSLEKNWLFDHKTSKSKSSASDDGDLIKAGLKAQQLRQKFPKAEFTVILTTNRTLSEDLMTKVIEKADELSVSVVFLEQSQIVHFLDIKPEGHWLRKKSHP